MLPASTRSLVGRGGSPDISFHPEVIIKNVSAKDVKRVGEKALDNLVFHLGLIGMLSYWKVTASPKIVIEAGYLNKKQTAWFKDLIFQGMGEYFFENKIIFTKKNFLTISSSLRANYPHLAPSKAQTLLGARLTNQTLAPGGGGKDGVVPLALL